MLFQVFNFLRVLGYFFLNLTFFSSLLNEVLICQCCHFQYFYMLETFLKCWIHFRASILLWQILHFEDVHVACTFHFQDNYYIQMFFIGNECLLLSMINISLSMDILSDVFLHIIASLQLLSCSNMLSSSSFFFFFH